MYLSKACLYACVYQGAVSNSIRTEMLNTFPIRYLKREIDVGFPSVWCEYDLLPLANKEDALAYVI